MLRAYSRIAEAAIVFVPKVAVALLLIIVGWLLARFLRAATRRLISSIGLDRLAARFGISEQIAVALGSRPPSELLAAVVFWVFFAIFLTMAINTLGLEAVTATLDRLVVFLPRVLGATSILVLGLVLGGFMRHVVASGAALGGTGTYGPRLGAATNLLIGCLAIILAVEQLGVNTQLLVALVTTVVATLTLTMGAAFALGARPVVSHVLAGHFLRERFPIGGSIEIDGFTGIVERIGSVDTVLRDGDQTMSVPNASLLERSVRR